MRILLENTGKKFNSDWIFRKINLEFSSGNSYAILGPNGSGKSTLIQVLCGYISPTEGKITFFNGDNSVIDQEEFFRHISIASPYLELIEEFSLPELIKFHSSLKPFLKGIGEKDFIEILALGKTNGKEIKYFSSGMKQRVRLALALLSDVPVIFLDEPLTNLDDSGKGWYKNLISKFTKEKLVFVSSNHMGEEYDFCGKEVNIIALKNST